MPARHLIAVPRKLPDVAMLLEQRGEMWGLIRIGKREYYVGRETDNEVMRNRRIYHREWDGPWYDVWETEHGLHGCTCRGFEFVCGPRRTACRHIAAVYLLGLFSLFPPPGCALRPEVSTPMENAA